MQEEKKIKNLLFVINPIAGDIDKEELEEEIRDMCAEHHLNCSIYRTTGEHDEAHIKELIGQHTFDAVFAVGGDGTVSQVGALLIGSKTPLGIIPLGSGNGLSKDLNIPQDTEEALHLIHSHIIRNIDTIDLNGHPSIHLSDLGFNALVVQRFCEGDKRGPGAYAWIALQEYMNYVPKYYRIETDTENFEGEAFMVTIANANAFGSNAAINPNGVLNDGRFEICLIEPFPKAAGPGILLRMYTDDIDSSIYTRRISCKRATIYNINHEVMHVDGEPVKTADEIKVTMHPKSLKVLLPAPDEELG
jgi:diacylglycerol kinase (ATP)